MVVVTAGRQGGYGGIVVINKYRHIHMYMYIHVHVPINMYSMLEVAGQ